MAVLAAVALIDLKKTKIKRDSLKPILVRRFFLRTLGLFVWSLLLTALTGFLGAAPLKVSKTLWGHRLFWLVSLVTVTALFFTPWRGLAILFSGIIILVGVFTDLEERGHSLSFCGILSIFVTSLLGGGEFAMWIYRYGSGWRTFLEGQIEAFLAPAKQIAGVSIDAPSLLLQAPSGLVILLMLALFSMVLLEDRIRAVFGLGKNADRHLIEFRAPEAFIWVLIGSLFFAFAKPVNHLEWAQPVALNLLNILIVFYFFQGLAVVVKAFSVFKVGVFWQIIFFSLVVFQLFLFVSLLGLADYWMNFRPRLSRKSAQWDKKENF